MLICILQTAKCNNKTPSSFQRKARPTSSPGSKTLLHTRHFSLLAYRKLCSCSWPCFCLLCVSNILPAAVIALFCRQYDIIKDNDSSNNKEKVKPSSERSTPEHHSGGLLRSKVSLWTLKKCAYFSPFVQPSPP